MLSEEAEAVSNGVRCLTMADHVVSANGAVKMASSPGTKQRGTPKDIFYSKNYDPAKLPFNVDEYVSLELHHGRLREQLQHYVAEFGKAVHAFDVMDQRATRTGEAEECDSEGEEVDASGDGPAITSKVKFGVAAGVHAVSVGGKDFYVLKSYAGLPQNDSWYTGLIVFVKLADIDEGRTPQDIFDAFLKEILKWAWQEEEKDGHITLYRYRFDSHGAWWESEGLKRGRPISSIIMDDHTQKSLIDDMNRFMRKSTREFYWKHGIPYRRTYLFYGPPGSGKSSLVKALAGAFKRSVSFLSLAHPQMTDQALADAFSSLPAKTILVIEDLDCVFSATAEKTERVMDESVNLTFSGVLNSLDGMTSSSSDTFTILTTNHFEKLNPALIRAGRVDRKFCLPRPSDELIGKFFLSFYPDASKPLVKQFVAKVREFSATQQDQNLLSLAVLQQMMLYFMEHTAEQVVEGADEFFAEFFPPETDAKPSLYM
ncbi:Mitochondrial chaperone BCS1 [Porphyridium purpureum]|uniref:Mitochondrial chaperone BCS1 n=1 Tax=Porphyridium purpureum TaxID=35688 RepID=A0A5J4YSB1_PORPP|nr:Mitochondrial chaperone BCS1 [Porphyridium purpureum]|eukprot:POR1920..scf229_5